MSRWMIWIGCLFSLNLNAQGILTLEDAVAEALKNNHGILIARQQAAIAKTNNTPGNAGMLPQVNLTVGDNFTLNNLNQKFSNGLEVQQQGVTGNVINAAVQLNWTIFDGLQMFVSKNRLNRLEELGALNFKKQVEQTIAQVILQYAELVRLQEWIRTGKLAVKLTDERAKLAEFRFKNGLASKSDWLQAQVDRNAAIAAERQWMKQNLQNKALLNELLGKEPETAFEVTDSLTFKKELAEEAQTQLMNLEIQLAEKQWQLSGLEVKSAKAMFYPRLGINAGYNYARNQSSAGFALFNQTNGLQAGVNLSVPLFGGLTRFTALKAAKQFQVQNEWNLKATRLRAQTQLTQAKAAYAEALDIRNLEEQNQLLAKENLEIAQERFRLGQSAATELREAEYSYQQALQRLSDSRYQLKASETELLRVKGQLMQ